MYYKLLTISNYSFFFYFKLKFNVRLSYRIYLSTVNFYFLFLDYIYLINYIKRYSSVHLNLFFLPVTVKTYSVLRSPFVYSKSKEHFEVINYKVFFNIIPNIKSSLYIAFFDKLISSVKLSQSKFHFKKFTVLCSTRL